MDLSEYQKQALTTDKTANSRDPKLIPVLGLASEAGTILTEFKKARRDNMADDALRERMCTELGDVLWYTAIVADRFGLDLNEVAAKNLDKARDLWLYPSVHKAYDESFPIWEQLPPRFTMDIRQLPEGRVTLACDGITVGDPLTDNAYVEDGYRFHDVFHLSYAAVLGWSPVVRRIMGLKRKSDSEKDTVDDGGRAVVIEEGISAFVFSYARAHNFFEGGEEIDIAVLQTIKSMVFGLEVASRSEAAWREAIIQGFAVFRATWANRGGLISVDTISRRLQYQGSPVHSPESETSSS